MSSRTLKPIFARGGARRQESRDPGPCCGDASVPSWGHAAGQNAFLHDEPGYGRHGIFGMLEHSFQRWIGKICLRLGLASGPGASAPGQIKKKKKKAPSSKLDKGSGI